MPSRKPRPKFGNGSSTDSLRDALYDALLASLRSGGGDFTTEEEYAAWVREWTAAHPGRSFPLPSDALPQPIARRQALTFLTVFDFPAYARTEQVIHEVEWADQHADEAEERVPLEPLDTGQLHAEWRQWRDGLIQGYNLAGLVSPSEERPEWTGKPD
jgi:hypothetical protein